MNQPNIIWITLDSVRADHTSMSGYSRDTTPTLQKMSADPKGRYFDQCLSHGRYTMVSSASILTGTYPSRHRAGYRNQAIPSTLPTIAERFRAQSYHTALISDNAFVSSATGLDRGFDRSVCLVPPSLSKLPATLLKTVGVREALKYLLGIRRHSVGFTTDLKRHSRTYLLDTVTKDWISSFAGKEPFFLYIHNDETHRPYYPPLPYRDTFTDEIAHSPSEAAKTSLRIHEDLIEIIANGCALSEEEWEALVAMYDSEIRYVDRWINNLIKFLRANQFGKTVIVVTADHGEFFGEHGLLGHQYGLGNAVLNVPLVTYGLDIDTRDVVQHVDVMATLLECADADTGGVQGVDLRSKNREYAIAQDHSLSTDQLLQHNPNVNISRFPTSRRDIICNGRYKLTIGKKTSALYRLPDEDSDVTSQFPDIANELEEQLTDWLKTEGQPFEGDAESTFSDEMREHLVDLGYLDEELPDE